jgi:hypothetical protein
MSTFALLAISSLVITGCPGAPQDQTHDPTLRDTQSAAEMGQIAFARLRELSATFAEEDAKQLLAEELASDPDVVSTEITEQGVWLEVVSGPDVMLLLDPLSGTAATTNPLARRHAVNHVSPGGGFLQAASNDNVRDRIDKGIAIIPTDSEFSDYTANMLNAADDGFRRIGAPDIIRVLGTACTLDAYRRLDGYGVIYLGGHSVWKAKASEAYIVTAETLDDGQDHARVQAAYGSSIASGDLKLCITEPIGGGGRVPHVVVGPGFVTDGLDLADESSLVWLGFCWGGLGAWRDAFRSAGASVAVGWDDSVIGVADLALARDMFEQMCDTSLGEPLSIELWHALAPSSYTDPFTGDIVSLVLRGNRSHTLWERGDDGDPADCTEAEVVVTSGVDLTISVDATRLDADGWWNMIVWSETGENSMFLPPGRWRFTAEALPSYATTWETEVDLTCAGYNWYLPPAESEP